MRKTASGRHPLRSFVPTQDAMHDPEAPPALTPPIAPGSSMLVEHLDSVDSTNLRLLDAPFGTSAGAARLLWADQQTAGRGRRGRSWLAEPDRSLCFSIAVESAARALDPSLSLAIGVTLARRLAPLSNGLSLKWPNDLLRHGAKCGGILVENRRGGPPDARIDRLVIGVGLNLLRPTDPQAQIGQPAEGVFDSIADIPARAALVIELGQALLTAWAQHRTEGFRPFIADWNGFDHWRGRAVRVTDAGEVVAEGQYQGIAEHGGLRIAGSDGERVIIAGDVSLREA